MRISKVIKDYVAQTVEKVYRTKIKELRDKDDITKAAINKELTAIMKEAEEKANALLVTKYSAYGFNSVYGSGSVFKRNTTITNQATEQEINSLQAEEKRKIQEILVSLELGGTKTDLDVMLSNL